jgi:hypothetical protein
MPKNKVTDLITDQEIAFARLVLSGAMTDRQAAQAVGLNPDSAAYTKAKPRVRDYMLEHRTAVEQQLVQQEVEGHRRRNLDREQVLERLWEIANLSPETTRGSVTGQVKALTMIIAMENFIPGRRAVAAENKSTPAPTAQIYTAAWRRAQQATTIDPQPSPSPAEQEDQKEDLAEREPEFAPGSAGETASDPTQSTFASSSNPSEAPPLAPYRPAFNFVPDLRLPFSMKKNPFARPR